MPADRAAPGDGAVEVTVATARDGVAVVAVHGDVDVAAVAAVRAGIAEAVALGPLAVVLDLGGCDLLASAGLTVLVETDRERRAAGSALLVAATRRTVLRPLRITGLDRVLAVHDDVDTAVAAAPGR